MIHFRQLQAWLASPHFPNEEEKTRQAYLINLIIRAGLILIISGLAILPWMTTARSFTQYFISIVTTFFSLLIAKHLLNHGMVRESGFFLTAVIWLTLAAISLAGPGGLSGTSFLGAITLTPLIAGFVSSTRASIIITMLNWVLGGILMVLELEGQIPIGTSYDPPARYLAFMIMFSTFPLLIYLWRRNFDEAVTQVRKVEKAQREAEAFRLQNEVLGEAVMERTSALEASLAREQQLAEKLAFALEQETQLGNLRSQIITVVSHEFRTPLSVISSSADLLINYYDRLPEERRNAAQTRIRESIHYLNDLLKDVTLVDQAQGERIRPSYVTLPFNRMCQQLSEQLRLQLSQPHRIDFNCAKHIETPIQTDFSLMQQIIGNLLSNALKYSPESEQVEVQSWFDGLWLVIEVHDKGIGIPLHEQEKIFELFYRASNVDERRGLGLGLFIVQAICQMMQGSVSVQSQGDGQGATFIVRLPLSPDQETGDQSK